MHHKVEIGVAPTEFVNAAIKLYHDGKIDDLFIKLSNLIKTYPNTYIFNNILGAIYVHKGLYKEAEKYFRKTIALQPEHPHAYNNLGIVLNNLNNYNEAKIFLKKAIALEPNYAEAHNNLGNSFYNEKKNYDKAIKEYCKATKIKPNFADAYNNLGNAYKLKSDFKNAEKNYRIALSLKPDFSETYNNLGNLLMEKSRIREAEKNLRHAIKLNNYYYEAYNNLGKLLQETNRLEESETNFRKALGIKDDAATTLYLLGITLFKLNRYNEAKLTFEQAIFLENNNSDYFNCLGMVFEKQKKIEKAMQNYEKALELNSNNNKAHHNIGNLFLELGKCNNAKQSFKRALKINPDLPETNLGLAIVFDYLDDLNTASNYCKRTIEISKNEQGLRAAVILAIIEYLKFNFSNSKEYLKQSFEVIQKKSPLYKNAKVYHGYLTKLINIHSNRHLKIPKISDKIFYVIGESHSLESHGLNIKIKGQDFFCRSLLIMGCMQWHLGNKSRNKYKIKFEEVFFKVPKSSNILLAIGEIDCRIDNGIMKYCSKYKKKNVNEVITKTVKNYLNYIEHLNKNHNHKIYLQGVPSPLIPQMFFNNEEITKQIGIIKNFNEELKIQSKRKGFGFLDIYELTNRGDGISNEVWHIDDFHISPDGILEAWKNFNIEN